MDRYPNRTRVCSRSDCERLNSGGSTQCRRHRNAVSKRHKRWPKGSRVCSISDCERFNANGSSTCRFHKSNSRPAIMRRRAGKGQEPFYFPKITNDICAICDGPLIDPVYDHEPPVARDLATIESPGIIRRVCRDCNAWKSDRLDSELDLPYRKS